MWYKYIINVFLSKLHKNLGFWLSFPSLKNNLTWGKTTSGWWRQRRRRNCDYFVYSCRWNKNTWRQSNDHKSLGTGACNIRRCNISFDRSKPFLEVRGKNEIKTTLKKIFLLRLRGLTLYRSPYTWKWSLFDCNPYTERISIVIRERSYKTIFNDQPETWMVNALYERGMDTFPWFTKRIILLM